MPGAGSLFVFAGRCHRFCSFLQTLNADASALISLWVSVHVNIGTSIAVAGGGVPQPQNCL